MPLIISDENFIINFAQGNLADAQNTAQHFVLSSIVQMKAPDLLPINSIYCNCARSFWKGGLLQKESAQLQYVELNFPESPIKLEILEK